ncbi:hypothetical protein [Roseicyclus mahoneyensis]|uniref:Uncharacterized protein n=1 Tax=Roseicyclus mahoneyensis TaxID=164332 RepID=A0A316GGU2_9RHOB|nr:hypothetical protein [Roseicyclus mahoneyensis]PWK59808.1 hypothetical protein C7455_10694 [Roseicyclus mahoneyensis]
MMPFLRALAFALSVLTLNAPVALAQTIAVQSGEHDGFTRLVLDIGADRDWSLTGTGETRLLTLDPPVAGFAIGRVFDLIPRDRLSALTAEEGLVLSLACDCDISASRYQNRYLVLDIAASPARSADPAPEAESDPDPRALDAVQRQAAAERLPDLTSLMAAHPARPTFSPPLPLAPEPTAPPAIDMAEAARIMSEQLARAAASGLLEAAPGRPLTDADPVLTAAIDASAAPAPAPAETAPDMPPPAQEPRPGVPLRAQTAFDMAQTGGALQGPQRNNLTCTGAALSMPDWSDTAGVDRGLGALRLALYDDRDQLQRDAVIALARHYLFYGFGAEAAYWLAQIDDAPAQLAVIAALVDDADGARFPAEPDPVICSDEELLWRYLDGGLEDHQMTADLAGRLQRATAALPTGLRDQIAPRMARRLDADGEGQAARNLRDMLLRGGRVPEAVMLRLDRDLGIVRADDPALPGAMALAVRDDGGDPVGAMAQALAFNRETGVTPPAVWLVAGEALLRENGTGPTTAVLWRELLLAHAETDGLDHVLTLLSQDHDLPQQALDDAMTALVADRLAAGDTAALFVLARLHGPTWQATGSEAGRARVGAMAHLRDAGLPEAAEMLRAGQRLLILPARPAPPPAAEDALRLAWETGDWTRVADIAAGAHHQIARRMITRDGPPPPMPDLPALAARVADSATLRQEVTSLLALPYPTPVEQAP